MEIIFKSRKLKKILSKKKKLNKKFGHQNARKIMTRMSVLKAANNLSEISHKPPERRHQLKGKRKGQFAIDVKNPYRLIFKPVEPVPKKEDGGIDLKRVTKIKILEIKDYH